MSLRTERENLYEILANCTEDLMESKSEIRVKENIIESLNSDIAHSEETVKSAKNSRSQELLMLKESIEELEMALKMLQAQYDDSLRTILEQSSIIGELNDKISSIEYTSQRNIRG